MHSVGGNAVCTTLGIIVRCVREPSLSGRWAAEDSECQVKAGADRVVASYSHYILTKWTERFNLFEHAFSFRLKKAYCCLLFVKLTVNLAATR